MARKPEQKKPVGEQEVTRAAPRKQGELAARKAPAAEGHHCGDMGLASREKQFRPGSGGR